MRTPSFCCVMTFLLSCATQAQSQQGNVFFPLNVGNQWVLDKKPYRLVVKVAERVDIKGAIVYKVEEISSSDEPPPIVRRCLFAYDSLYNVLRFNRCPDSSVLALMFERDIVKKTSVHIVDSFIVSMWYKFDASINETWDAVANSEFNLRSIDPYRIKLESNTDTVITGEGTYYHCFRFCIDDLVESDNEYWDWIAPGVGIVKRTYLNRNAKGAVLTSHKLEK